MLGVCLGTCLRFNCSFVSSSFNRLSYSSYFPGGLLAENSCCTSYSCANYFFPIIFLTPVFLFRLNFVSGCICESIHELLLRHCLEDDLAWTFHFHQKHSLSPEYVLDTTDSFQREGN